MARGLSSSSLLERDVKLELSSLGDRDIVKECGQYETEEKKDLCFGDDQLGEMKWREEGD